MTAAETSARPQAGVSSGLPTYRAYAKSQADMLIGMIRVLAKEIQSGNVEAAQNEYAMAHRYLGRVKPLISSLNRDLDESMDANFQDAATPPRPPVSGFHRIEYGLYAASSTEGMVPSAQQLLADASRLRTLIAAEPLPAGALIAGAVKTTEAISARTLVVGDEPFSKTDLWDIEAYLDGAQEVVTAVAPQLGPRHTLLLAKVSVAFAKASDRLSRFKDGCGYRSFETLTSADKADLRQAVGDLAARLTDLRQAAAMID